MNPEDNPREQDRHECATCGREFDSEASLNGHVSSMGHTKDSETDENATDDAVSESMTTNDQSLRSELETILPGKAPLQNVHARHEGGIKYTVLSARDGGPRYYHVELGVTPKCTCPDLKYNRDQDDHEICKHIVAAMLADRLPLDESLGQLSIDMIDGLNAAVERADRAASDIEDVRDTLEGDLIAARDANAGTSQTDADTSQSSADQSSGVDASEAADRLSDAFADVVDDMQVKAANGQVWFQTGKETPDDWPFPGGDSTFDVLTGPDMVKFVHDGSADWADSPHPLFDDKPGEWWKNALDPEDVDEYISEVLS